MCVCVCALCCPLALSVAKCVLMRLHTISTMTACSLAETYRAGGVTFVPFLCALTNSLRAKALGCRTIVAQQKNNKKKKNSEKGTFTLTFVPAWRSPFFICLR